MGLVKASRAASHWPNATGWTAYRAWTGGMSKLQDEDDGLTKL